MSLFGTQSLGVVTLIYVVFASSFVLVHGDDFLKFEPKEVHESTLHFASYYADHMVLQKAPQRAMVWGYASADDVNSVVKVQLISLADFSVVSTHQMTIKSDPQSSGGVWAVKLKATPPGGPYVIRVKVKSQIIEMKDVLFGDVWLCGGQSNMQFGVSAIFNASEEIANAKNFPHIRLFDAQMIASPVPLSDLKGVRLQWTPPSSAVYLRSHTGEVKGEVKEGGQRGRPKREAKGGGKRGGNQRGRPKKEAKEGGKRGRPKGEAKGGGQRGRPKGGGQRGGNQRGRPKKEAKEGGKRGRPKGEAKGGGQRGRQKREAKGGGQRGGNQRGRPKKEAKEGGKRGRPKGRPKGEAKEGGKRGRPKGEAKEEATKEGGQRRRQKREAKGGGQRGGQRGRPKKEAKEGGQRGEAKEEATKEGGQRRRQKREAKGGDQRGRPKGEVKEGGQRGRPKRRQPKREAKEGGKRGRQKGEAKGEAKGGGQRRRQKREAKGGGQRGGNQRGRPKKEAKEGGKRGRSWTYFSAVCWLYGKHLYETLGYPIGLVESCWGGTPVEAWSSPDALKVCGLKHLEKDLMSASNQRELIEMDPFYVMGPSKPTQLWNSMIHPLLNMTIYGAIWYQGENNAARPDSYNCTFPSMISDWRKKFYFGSNFETNPTFPFGFVQLGPKGKDGSKIIRGFPDIRWHQTADVGYVPNPRMDNVFMAAAIDDTDLTAPSGPVHARDKTTIGKRLGVAGLSIAYGLTRGQFQGPFPSSYNISRDQTTLTIMYDYNRHKIQQRSSDGFEVCCSHDTVTLCPVDGNWTAAPVIHVGATTVQLSWRACGADTYVMGLRYEWRLTPCAYKKCAIYSVENELPAPPFIFQGFFGLGDQGFFGLGGPYQE
ncbi:Sialate O-acetylesterase [Lamellibrachia satsuma]|nr:Sialate O-acetylesterase [Lamellibrachia satsuma]